MMVRRRSSKPAYFGLTSYCSILVCPVWTVTRPLNNCAALPGGKEIVLVALTGYGQDSDRRKSQAAGFDLHLVKPASIEALQEVFTRPAKADRQPS